MLITAGDEGLHTRPMGLLGQAGDFHGTLWFITDDRSRKVADLAASAHAAVAFQNDEAGGIMHLDGRAAQSHDRARLAQLYTPVQRTWSLAGLDDPHMTLIRSRWIAASSGTRARARWACSWPSRSRSSRERRATSASRDT